MSTFNSPDIIARMLENNGKYPNPHKNKNNKFSRLPDDPEPHSIWQYTSGFGSNCFKICRTQWEEMSFLAHGNIAPGRSPICLYEGALLGPMGIQKRAGLTEAGQLWLNNFGQSFCGAEI